MFEAVRVTGYGPGRTKKYEDLWMAIQSEKDWLLEGAKENECQIGFSGNVIWLTRHGVPATVEIRKVS